LKPWRNEIGNSGDDIDQDFWFRVDETLWNKYFPTKDGAFESGIVRVFPGTPEYEQVKELRYQGLVRSGYLDPHRDTVDSMSLERDKDSIILAAIENGIMILTMTLNTPTRAFPKLAVELEKDICFEDELFHCPDVIEVVKLSVTDELKVNTYLHPAITVAYIVGILAGKRYFLNVSRRDPQAIGFMEKCGYYYPEKFNFIDASLNNMPSSIGYCKLCEIMRNPRTTAFFRRYARLLHRKFPELQHKDANEMKEASLLG
jgi:hypothetical protein